MTEIQPAPSYLDLLFGQHEGFVATAFGSEPYRDDRGRYRHRDWREIRFRWPAERSSLKRSVEQELAAGKPVDVYVCPALRATDARTGFGGQKGTNAAPPHVLWADLDQPADAAKLERLDALVVDSGQAGHHHIYVLLQKAVSVPTHRALNKALAVYLAADAKWSDDALLRLPCTLNFKPTAPPAGVQPGPARQVRVVKSLAKEWPAQDIAGVLGVDLTASTNTTSKPAAAFSGNAESAPDPLPPLVMWALYHDDIKDRSKAHARLVGACLDAGLTLGQTVSVCAVYRPSADKYGNRLPDETARFWGKATAARNARTQTPARAEPPTRAAIVGMLRKVLSADGDDRTRLTGWATRKLRAHAAAGHLDPVYVRNVVEQLNQAATGGGGL